ncbi:MAG: sugar transferase [Clostridia bacterium]|nr:sugar transferase [Clostridia bacterium]
MKRIFDFTVSLLLIIFLSPVFLIVALVVLVDSGHPVIFRQYRVGKGNKLFYIYKFRTMRVNTRNASTDDLSEAEQAITRSGRVLRKTSLDELPQLFNVLTGKMSFVGPRPLIPEEKEIRQLRKEYNVYSVRPGITGLAQINGRDMLSAEEKALFDKEYVEKQSFLFDIKILFKTVMVVLKRENILEGGEKGNSRKP